MIELLGDKAGKKGEQDYLSTVTSTRDTSEQE